MLLVSFLGLAAIIGVRVLWQRRPGLLTCCLFWVVAAALIGFAWTWTVYQGFLAAGIACNALVTLANGGYMPVASHRKLAGPARSVWVQREDAKYLLFLGDNFGNNHVRFSIGDVLLAAGIVLSVVNV